MWARCDGSPARPGDVRELLVDHDAEHVVRHAVAVEEETLRVHGVALLVLAEALAHLTHAHMYDDACIACIA